MEEEKRETKRARSSGGEFGPSSVRVNRETEKQHNTKHDTEVDLQQEKKGQRKEEIFSFSRLSLSILSF